MAYRTCFHCGKAVAVLPTSNPCFCSTECAVAQGMNTALSHCWCEKHLTWFNPVYGCDACTKLQQIADMREVICSLQQRIDDLERKT